MRRHNLHRPQNGFSLVELMLALVLGLVVVTGIVQLFVGNSQTYNVLNGQARVQESARFALDIISRAARSAGYFGCASSRDNLVWNITGGNLDNAGLVPEFDATRSVQGLNDVGGAGDLAAYPTTTANALNGATGINADAVIPGTDVLVVRSMASPAWPLSEKMFPAGANSNPRIPIGSDLDVGDIVMVANCEQAVVFRVTGRTESGAQATLEHAIAGGTVFDNTTAQVTSIGRTYSEDSQVGRIESTYFFIAEGTGLSNALDGDGDPVPALALWQKAGTGAPQELVQGVEDLQVLYGVDTSNDELPNASEYVTANQLNLVDPGAPRHVSDVVSLRVTITVNSVDEVTADGEMLRRTFSKTIRLRNANPEPV